jgi:hypothetical protein
MMGGINGSLDVYGIDCHRNWEILYLGRIPIVEDNYFVNEIYGDLPVIIVDDFKNINKDILLEYINHFENFHFNNDKLKFSYWKKIIKP